MRATPLQRYALRLLFATGHDCGISRDHWASLQQDEAERLMNPYGGRDKIMRETQLPVKPVPEKTQVSKNTESNAPSRAGHTKEKEIELGE